MHFGWWDIDVGSLTLANRLTGQKLSYSGEIADDNGLEVVSTPNLQWMRLDYSDSQFAYPLLVQRRRVPDNLGARRNTWRVDYLRSARVWAREGGFAEQPPPYGTWRRVDECVREGLCCWPKSRHSGPRPGNIVLEGGWHNGAWSTTLYRSTTTVSDSDLEEQKDSTIEPWLPALETVVPSPWRLVEGTGGGKSCSLADWGFEGNAEGKLYLPLERDLTVIDRPHLSKQDNSAFLIPIAVRRVPSHRPETDWTQFFVRLLYVDAEVVCDAFEARNHFATAADAAAVEWQVMEDYAGGKIGAIDRATTESLVVLRETPMTRAISERNGVRTYLRNLSRDSLHRRLSTAISEALLAWEAKTLRLPESDTGDLREVTMPRASLINCFGPMVAGLPEATVRLKVATNLLPNAAGQPHSLRSMFQEDDGILRATMRTELLGWWDFDPNATALVNRFSEQRIVFSGRFEGPRDITASEPGERQWFRFDYRDRFTEFPVLVRRAHRELNGPLTGAWEIDYIRSNRLWIRESGRSQNYPDYGLWRRLHECVCDALVCWPELEATGEIAAEATSVGGWANGKWADLLKTYWRCQHMRRQDTWTKESNLPYYGAVEAPIPEPLRAAAPPAWRFFDAPMAERGASIDGLEIDLKERRLDLPSGSDLRGFERQIPFVRRDDGNAVMFPHGLYSHLFRGEDYSVKAEMLYADEHILALLRDDWGKVNLMHGVMAKGLRGKAEDDAEDLWRSTELAGYRRSLFYPSLRLYRHFLHDLSNAWLAWSGCDKRVLDDPAYIEKINRRDWFKTPYEKSGFSLQRPNSVTFESIYLGGLFFPYASQTFTLRTAAEEAAGAKASAEADAKLQIIIDRMQTATRNRTRGKR